MTMVKREGSSIWSRVRSDVDVDDLIFDNDRVRTSDETPCSDR